MASSVIEETPGTTVHIWLDISSLTFISSPCSNQNPKVACCYCQSPRWAGWWSAVISLLNRYAQSGTLSVAIFLLFFFNPSRIRNIRHNESGQSNWKSNQHTPQKYIRFDHDIFPSTGGLLAGLPVALLKRFNGSNNTVSPLTRINTQRPGRFAQSTRRITGGGTDLVADHGAICQCVQLPKNVGQLHVLLRAHLVFLHILGQKELPHFRW
jgi:hypothetical protein